MHHTRILSVLLALAASACPLRAEVVPILSDTAGAVKDGATSLKSTGGEAKTLAIPPKSTAFSRFATGDTGILASEVARGAASLPAPSVYKHALACGGRRSPRETLCTRIQHEMRAIHVRGDADDVSVGWRERGRTSTCSSAWGL